MSMCQTGMHTKVIGPYEGSRKKLIVHTDVVVRILHGSIAFTLTLHAGGMCYAKSVAAMAVPIALAPTAWNTHISAHMYDLRNMRNMTSIRMTHK